MDFRECGLSIINSADALGPTADNLKQIKMRFQIEKGEDLRSIIILSTWAATFQQSEYEYFPTGMGKAGVC